MARQMTISGIEELQAKLSRLEDKAPKIAAQALYEGAAVVADALTNAVNSVCTEPFKYAEEGETRLPSPQEVAVLRGRCGVAKFRNDGLIVNTIVGFNKGYGMVAGKSVPVPMIVNAINSGTSFMKKQPVFSRATNGAKASASAAIVAKANELINEEVK